ncbi:MAG: NAD-dependent epimerase/dehydratase family protein [Woeseiaceae bacterium]
MGGLPIIIVGAGYVGRRVVSELHDPATIVLGRSTSLDLDVDSSLPVTLPDAYHVLYTVPPSPAHADDPRLARLLSLLDRVPQRFIYISTTGVYGDCGGAIVNEESNIQPLTERAKRRVAAETLLQSWARERTVHHKILRTPGIYGPGRLGLERLQKMRPLINEAEANPGNRIHVDDLVECCITALRGDAPAGIYNIGDGDHRSPTWFSKEVAKQAGLSAPPEVGRETQSESRRVATQHMREILGVTPRYANAEDGIRASLKIVKKT